MWVYLLVLPSKNHYSVLIFLCFYCFVTFLTGYISVCKLATLRSFCGSRSQMLIVAHALPVGLAIWKLAKMHVQNRGAKKLRNPQLCFVSSWHATRPGQLTCHTYSLLYYIVTTSDVSVANKTTLLCMLVWCGIHADLSFTAFMQSLHRTFCPTQWILSHSSPVMNY